MYRSCSDGDSRNQIHRYIRLTNLITEILQMVDDGKIALTPAVELSYLSAEEQERLLETALQTVEALLVGARKRAGETDRLYVSLGLLIGLMLALVVI